MSLNALVDVHVMKKSQPLGVGKNVIVAPPTTHRELMKTAHLYPTLNVCRIVPPEPAHQNAMPLVLKQTNFVQRRKQKE